MSHSRILARSTAILLLAIMLVWPCACSLFLEKTNPTPIPTQIIAEPTFSPDTINRKYTWNYDGTEWQWNLSIPQSLYDYYASRPRAMTQDYSIYVTNPKDDEYLDTLIDKIDDVAANAGYGEIETVNFAVSFVQSMPYVTDNVTTAYDEYPRYPIETLVDDGGDCEDTSILMAAILDGMGYDTVLLSLPDHMAVGVRGPDEFSGTYWPHNGGQYFYLETTGAGWGIGELPSEYTGASASIYDIMPVPILEHDWTAESSWFNKMNVTVTVENMGTETATDVYIYAAFDAGGDMVWNSGESEHFDLAPDQSITITMQLDIPQNEHTRMLVEIVDNGYAVDESYSEWFDT